jgi:hypothetical protein
MFIRKITIERYFYIYMREKGLKIEIIVTFRRDQDYDTS